LLGPVFARREPAEIALDPVQHPIGREIEAGGAGRGKALHRAGVRGGGSREGDQRQGEGKAHGTEAQRDR